MTRKGAAGLVEVDSTWSTNCGLTRRKFWDL